MNTSVTANAPAQHPLAALPYVAVPPTTQAAVPDAAQCYALWDHYQMLDNVRAHSAQVADIAVAVATMAVARGYAVDVAAVRASALLHDIAKTYTLRHGGSHAQIGASWVVAATGNRAVAQGVLLHVHWPWAIDTRTVCTLPFFIIYADKRVQHDQCVSLDARYEDLLVRYGHTAQQRASIGLSYAQGQQIEQALSHCLGVDLHAYTLDCGRLVQRT